MALIEPGDTVMGMDLAAGGHLTHGAPVSFSGQTYNFVSYSVDPETELLDFDAILKQAQEVKTKTDCSRCFSLFSNYRLLKIP